MDLNTYSRKVLDFNEAFGAGRNIVHEDIDPRCYNAALAIETILEITDEVNNPAPPDVRDKLDSVMLDVKLAGVEICYLREQVRIMKRLLLNMEELGEMAEAYMKGRPKADQEDELGDLLYTTIGQAHELNYDLSALMTRVAAKNEAKLNNPAVTVNAHGKIMKETDGTNS